MAYPDASWMDRAACLDMDEDMFFDQPKTRLGEFNIKAAKHKCRSECPVRQQCLNYAMRTDQPRGIWGGFTRGERLALVRKHRRLAGAA